MTYFHIELETHDTLLAEGVPAETYLDTGNRTTFENAKITSLHPRFVTGPTTTGTCHPLVTSPDIVMPIWERIATRAGYSTDDFPFESDQDGVRLAVGNELVSPVVHEGGWLEFILSPGHDGTMHLVSRAARPSQSCPWLDDRRRLGACIGGVFVDGNLVPSDSPLFREGWWPREPGSATRWTDGRGAVILDASATHLVVELLGTAPVASPLLVLGHRVNQWPLRLIVS